MSIYRNGRRAVTGRRSGTAFTHMLRAATIAVVASSCSSMMEQSEADPEDAAMSPASGEEYAPPEIKLLTEEERARFEEFLAKEGYRDVQFMSIVHTEDGREQLTTLDLFGSGIEEFKIDEDEFLIPPAGIDFGRAIVAYTGSPADVTSCGRRTSTGGTRYRSCIGSR
jgi:hypothetical protein